MDLTTAKGGDASLLRRHLQELRRRVERHHRFKGVEVFAVETTEGNGVLHMVWAWVGQRSFYLPQAWLSDEWAEIHGAPVVWVQRMGTSRTDAKRVSRYFAVQYLADQRGALVRMSWSWKRSRVAIAKAWKHLQKLASVTFQDGTWSSGRPKYRREWCYSMADVIAAWQSLLVDGWAMLGDTLIEIRGRDVAEVF